MLLALGATLIVIVALLWEVITPRVVETYQRHKARRARVPVTSEEGRREARMVKAFEDVPRDADRVIFFPRAAGGR